MSISFKIRFKKFEDVGPELKRRYLLSYGSHAEYVYDSNTYLHQGYNEFLARTDTLKTAQVLLDKFNHKFDGDCCEIVEDTI